MLAVRAVAVVLTAWVLAILAPPGPASAGGPDQRDAVRPWRGQDSFALLLRRRLRAARPPGRRGRAGTVDESGRSHEAGTGVTVTWLIHDVEPWRVDRIYLAGDDGPWIATQEMLTGTGSIWDAPVVWHQPADGKELTLLLDSLGVVSPERPARPAQTAVPTSRRPRSSRDPPCRPRSSPRPRHRLLPTTVPPPRPATVCCGGSEGWQAVCCSPRAGHASGHAGRRLTNWDPDAEGLDTSPAKEWLTSAGR